MAQIATRRERVVLDLEDRFTRKMARAAASAALLDKNLSHLSGTARGFDRDWAPLASPRGSLAQTRVQSVQASREIDRLSGRVKLLAQGAAILGPALVPIGAVGIPAVMGLATQFGAAALAGGTAIIAFHSVGDALKAANKAAIEPTAANLEAARLAMQKLGPEAQEFVRALRDVMPAFVGVRNAAGAGLFPGLVESLDDLERVLPQVEKVAFAIGDALGDLASGGAESLSGARWRGFINFLGTDVPPILTSLAHTVGNLTHGLAEMWMAFDPLNDDFASWMESASGSFDKWAQGLSETEGFQEFVAYVRENGPLVADALGNIGLAVVRIAEAAAPLGGPVLQALSTVAEAIGTIAGSDAGPAIMATVTALALLSRGMKTFQAISSTTWAAEVRGLEKNANMMSTIAARKQTMIRGGAALAGLGVAASGVASEFGLANTASLALMGTIAGPWGAAVGGATGLILDFANSQDDTKARMDDLTETFDRQTGAITLNTQAKVTQTAQDDGLLDAAEALGLRTDIVTQAIMGNAAAYEELRRATEGYDPNYTITSDEHLRDSGYTEAEISAIKAERAATQLREALPGLQHEFKGSAAEAAQFAAGMGHVEGGFDQATGAAQTFRSELERVNAVLSRRGSMRDYQASLDDFRKGLPGQKGLDKILGPGGRIDISLPKGREVQAQLDAIAGAAFKVAENMNKADRKAFLQGARGDFIQAAKLLGVGGDEARRLADLLGLVDRSNANPKINLEGVDPSIQRLIALQNQIDSMRGKTIQVTTVFGTAGSRYDTRPDVGGGRYASGGWTGPGRKYDPAGVVHRDEFVFSKAATHGNVGMLDALHRQLRGYDSGGYVGGRSGGGSARIAVDIGELRVRGTLQTPWGPAEIDGLAVRAAEKVYDSRQRHERILDRD